MENWDITENRLKSMPYALDFYLLKFSWKQEAGVAKSMETVFVYLLVYVLF